MRRFYDFMISASTASTSFSAAVALNNLLRYYPGSQKLVVVFLLLVVPVFGVSIYTPKYRVIGISLLASFCLGVVVAWLT